MYVCVCVYIYIYIYTYILRRSAHPVPPGHQGPVAPSDRTPRQHRADRADTLARVQLCTIVTLSYVMLILSLPLYIYIYIYIYI